MKKKEAITAFCFSAILLAALVAAGCSHTFLVLKDGKSSFFGKNKEGMYKLLCESGDMTAILADAQLPAKITADLYKYNCAVAEQSPEKVAAIYSSMTPDQRHELRYAFNKHKYDINYLGC